MKNNEKFISVPNIVLIMAFPLLASIVVFYYNKTLGTVGFLLSVILYFFLKSINSTRAKELQKYVDNVSYSFDSITKNVVFEMPFPIVIVEGDRKIKWHNSFFRDLFPDETLISEEIEKIIPEFSGIEFDNEEIRTSQNVKISDKVIQFYYSTIFDEDHKKCQTFLYGIDNTYDESIKKLFKDKRLVFYSVIIDNYEDIRNSSTTDNRPQVLGEIDRVINEYFKKYNCL